MIGKTMHLDMYQTMLVGILALLLGFFLNGKVGFLRRVCIPAPVTGGVLFSLISLALFSIFGIETTFDGTLKDVCMMVFFTSVGYQSDLSVIKKGGRPLLVMVLLVALLIIIQNAAGVGIARCLSIDPLIGMAAGSIPMCGGHGTAAGFNDMLEGLGVKGASSLTLAAATFGLLAGSLIGGPLAEHIIRKRGLAVEGEQESRFIKESESQEASDRLRTKNLNSDALTSRNYTKAVYELFIAIGLGTGISKLLALTGISFPTYFGSLLAAVAVRNCTEQIKGCPKVAINEIVSIGNICLSLFLGMAMVSLRLWELADMALPLVLMLGAQVVIMVLFAGFVAFPMLGKNYDAAVLVSGLCGFGLGATPNAMANMSAVCNKYKYATMPFIIIPIVGAIFVDIINISIITLFINII